jgi:hypothetical protein
MTQTQIIFFFLLAGAIIILVSRGNLSKLLATLTGKTTS